MNNRLIRKNIHFIPLNAPPPPVSTPHTVVTRYYGFTLDGHAFVHLPVVRQSIHPSAFRFRVITWVNIKNFHGTWYVQWYCGHLVWDCLWANFVKFCYLPEWRGIVVKTFLLIAGFPTSMRNPWSVFLLSSTNCLPVTGLASPDMGNTFHLRTNMS